MATFEDVFLFYTNEGEIPPEVVGLLERTKEEHQVETVRYYTIYDGHKFRLSPEFGVLRPSNFSISKYIRNRRPEINRKELIQKLTKMINVEGTLPVESETLQITEVWDPTISFTEGSMDWISIMIRNTIAGPRVVGVYNGFAAFDRYGNTYNSGSTLELSYDYRGQGLCRPFAAFTYRKVREHYGVDYMCIQIAAENKYAACKCYVQAALDAGFIPFVDFRQLTNKEECSVYEDKPDSNMILLHQEARVSMEDAFASCHFRYGSAN
jgi:hypothetical protein